MKAHRRVPKTGGTARCEQAIISVKESLGIESSHQLAKLCATRSDRQREAVWLAGVMRVREAVSILIDIVEDRNDELGCLAATSLGLIGSRAATKTLIRVLKTTTSSELRIASTYALDLLGDRRAFGALSGVLNRISETPRLRGPAAEALVSCVGTKRGRAVQILTAHLEDASSEVRLFCANSLGALGSAAALGPLEEHLGDTTEADPYGTVGEEAAWAISSIQGAGQLAV